MAYLAAGGRAWATRRDVEGALRLLRVRGAFACRDAVRNALDDGGWERVSIGTGRAVRWSTTPRTTTTLR